MKTSLLADAPDTDVSRQEMAAAGLKAFFAIAGQWGLTASQQQILLGNPSRSRFFTLKQQGSPGAKLSDDELDRLAYIGGIYTALNILYSEHNAVAWLRNPRAADSIWHGQAPLDYMLSGKMAALIDVYRYLNGLRGAA